MESLLFCNSRTEGELFHSFTILCTYDPSTARPYALEVDDNCRTCEQAQRYLLAPHRKTLMFGNPAASALGGKTS
ncbi:MAG: hypothetical protein ACRCYP_03520 [Alphaproteobacteria bacterium]